MEVNQNAWNVYIYMYLRGSTVQVWQYVEAKEEATTTVDLEK